MSLKNLIKAIIGNIYKNHYIKELDPKFSLILMYHRLYEEKPHGLYDPSLFVSKQTFQMHLQELSKFFNVVPLHQLFDLTTKLDRLCAITFDDGWKDNFDLAFPILKAFKMPATIFLPVHSIERAETFWFEKLFQLANLVNDYGRAQDFNDHFGSFVPYNSTANTLELSSLLCLVQRLKELPADTLDQIVDDAIVKCGLTLSNGSSLISYEQAGEMGKNGISFGSHGLNHFLITTLNRDKKSREIMDSMKLLQQKKINYVNVYAYPNGDWDEDAVIMLKKAGYLGALTTKIGINRRDDNLYALKRVGIHEYVASSSNLFWFRIYQATTSNSSQDHSWRDRQ